MHDNNYFLSQRSAEPSSGEKVKVDLFLAALSKYKPNIQQACDS